MDAQLQEVGFATVEVVLADGRPHRLRKPTRAFYPLIDETTGKISIGLAFELGTDPDLNDRFDVAAKAISTAKDDAELFAAVWACSAAMLRAGEPDLTTAQVCRLLSYRPDDRASQAMLSALCDAILLVERPEPIAPESSVNVEPEAATATS